MSGIVGIYHPDGQPVEREHLGRMVDILAHRGPDGADVWCEGSVGLGHRMLWTTPESLLEKLPLVDRVSNLAITADARIDNRDELIPALDLSVLPAEKITDSHIILAAYQKWGESCPEKLLGDFAFAIWDGQEQKLFCARDHFGVKPFYYYASNQTFVFASEIKGLLCLPQVLRKINDLRITDYLYPMLEDKSITIYEGIWRLPPAHYLTISYKGNIKLNSYWSLEKTGQELKLNSDAEYAEAFLEVFSEAVRCRLRSAFPIGSHLSGGLDSSSITCLARDLLASEEKFQLHTFSNIYDDVPECDERSYINPILDRGGLIPHYVHPDRIGPLSDWERLLDSEEEPCLFGGNGFLVWGMNQAIQQAGVRIALDGFDGDTTVSHGTGYFAELARQGQWEIFVAEASAISKHFQTSPANLLRRYGFTYLEELAKNWRWIAFATTVYKINQHFNVSPKQLWFRLGLKPILPQSVLKFWRRLRGYNPSLNSQNRLINPSFAERMRFNERFEDLACPESLVFTDREDQWRSFSSGIFTLVLEQVDRSAAAFSIESRHPFMDKRLIEFCMALPSSQKLNQGWSRAILRRAMNEILPESVQWRGGKMDMTPNFLHGLLKLNRELLDKIVTSNLERIETYVDLETVRSAYERLVSGEQINNQDINTVWTAVTLALWLDHTEIVP